MNLAVAIEEHPAERAALVSRGKATSWGELRDQVARMRGGLSELGVEPGDRVALLAANNWYFVSSYLAVLGVGAVAVPLNPASPAPEVERELEAVGAGMAIVGPTSRNAIAGVDIDRVPTLNGVVTASELLDGDPAPIVERGDDDLAVLLFTSGTAGAPKAARLTHGNLRSNIEQVIGFTGGEPTPEVALAVLPLFHVFGLNALLGVAMTAGWTTVLMERFDAHAAVEAITTHGVTVVSGVPTMWSALATLPGVDPEAFAGVRLAISGAAGLDPIVQRLVEERLGVSLSQGYGLTEASPVVTSTLGRDAPPGSIGVPLPGVEVRLVDAEGHDVLVGDPGELGVRGPNVFGGYWGDEAATAAALTPEGWLKTGDVAVVDDDGFLVLVDRVKDVVIVSGFNVFPAEVEEVLAQHPAVAEAAVVGVPHPHTGEAIKAFVVPVDGATIEEDALVAFVGQRLARYKAPSTIAFVDDLPYTVAGKLVRRSLR